MQNKIIVILSMKTFDFNSKKGILILWLLVILLIFSLARFIKPIVYDITDETVVMKVGDEYIVASAYRTHSTEEWEKNIKAENS